jgi:hypothetical protein
MSENNIVILSPQLRGCIDSIYNHCGSDGEFNADKAMDQCKSWMRDAIPTTSYKSGHLFGNRMVAYSSEEMGELAFCSQFYTYKPVPIEVKHEGHAFIAVASATLAALLILLDGPLPIGDAGAMLLLGAGL